MIKNIEFIGSNFKDYKVIIFENDSSDGTKELLSQWQMKNPKVKIISQDFGFKKRPSIKFLASIRNKYLEEMVNSEYKDFDLLMLLDMDMSYGVDIRGVFDSIAKIDQWDMVCANGIFNSAGKMYDAYAYRDKKFPFSPIKWQQLCFAGDERCNYPSGIIKDLLAFRNNWQASTRLYWLKIIPQIQSVYKVNSPLHEVNSCFGGMAIYKKAFITNCLYDSENEDCEHVAFHDCIKSKNKSRNYLNPNMVLRYSHFYSLELSGKAP
jgi:hypothetical protein